MNTPQSHSFKYFSEILETEIEADVNFWITTEGSIGGGSHSHVSPFFKLLLAFTESGELITEKIKKSKDLHLELTQAFVKQHDQILFETMGIT
jgi:hypothetical protein